MEFDAKNCNGKPGNLDRRLINARQITSGPVFESLAAFSDWLALELRKLEASYPDFLTERSSRSFDRC